eukprot:CAMPEP_0206237592 /NCGR_PEP_ID=MMETSP0047_2-20121206/14351_1 /ASSEMBLY_ACC=CAM_ASM_000192 /TAXON_ID=195065 /ORGANISM="Chroomonas mesostigmatica_cf, Strain CCMP1168" /LENGTH=342 /DNA_ID=CAMNT_0053662045 /DNA_START=416 /DNA_END=1445 /DNA_ORIENTATION=+
MTLDDDEVLLPPREALVVVLVEEVLERLDVLLQKSIHLFGGGVLAALHRDGLADDRCDVTLEREDVCDERQADAEDALEPPLDRGHEGDVVGELVIRIVLPERVHGHERRPRLQREVHEALPLLNIYHVHPWLRVQCLCRAPWHNPYRLPAVQQPLSVHPRGIRDAPAQQKVPIERHIEAERGRDEVEVERELRLGVAHVRYHVDDAPPRDDPVRVQAEDVLHRGIKLACGLQLQVHAPSKPEPEEEVLHVFCGPAARLLRAVEVRGDVQQDGDSEPPRHDQQGGAQNTQSIKNLSTFSTHADMGCFRFPPTLDVTPVPCPRITARLSIQIMVATTSTHMTK